MDPLRYYILIEFAYKHLDFQLAELESVLSMIDLELGSDACRIEVLPNEERFQREKDKQAKEASDKLKALGESRRPFVVISLPDDKGEHIADHLLAKCTLVRSVMELWGMGGSHDVCVENVKQWTENKRREYEKFADASKSWKVTVHTLGSKFSREEQGAMRSSFSFLKFAGPVRMKACDNEYVFIREVELDANGGALYPRSADAAKEHLPLACYFGRTLGGMRSTKGRADLDQYSLKRRAYLGPTSMDAELSFVMASLGRVRQGSWVLDPFVGTGSILLSCSLRGAYCVGTDIDIRVLRGKNDNENVFSNFRQFGRPRPELIRSDNAIYHRHYRTNTPIYDAIVCDPPYGIRAGARKSGSRRENPHPILDEHRSDHIAQTRPYAVSDVMADLLDVAARTLVRGGRLVYIIPSFSDFDPEADLPQHECLRTVHICYQPLAAELGRRVVAMEKRSDYDIAKREEYLERTWKNGPASAEKCANIRDKLIEAAKKKPGYEQRASFRKQKRQRHRQEKKRAKLG